jgi:hypothetical protein
MALEQKPQAAHAQTDIESSEKHSEEKHPQEYPDTKKEAYLPENEEEYNVT